MGIFSWLFNRPKAVKSNTAAKHQPAQAQSQVAQPDLQAIPQIRRDKHFLRVDSLSFSGVYQLSKSKKWAIAWRDSDPSAGRGGHRESGLGAYVLADASSGTVACHGSMPRPNNGHVCDTGVFCLEDWHFGSTLSGTFSVYDSSGSVVFTRELTANILTSGISRHGKYAFCATANSPTDHGNKVFLFDLVNRVEMYSAPRRPDGLIATKWTRARANSWRCSRTWAASGTTFMANSWMPISSAMPTSTPPVTTESSSLQKRFWGRAT